MLALGEKLIAEIQLSADVDTLARWMAHYLAELLVSARSKDPDIRDQANARVFQTILDLWTHRQSLPEKSRPFREFKPVCQVLRSLDLESNFARFFTYKDDSSTRREFDGSTDNYLTLIKAIDRAARLLIQFLIQLATEKEAEKGLEWLAGAELAGVPDDDETIAIRFVVVGSDVPRPKDAGAEKLEKIDHALTALKLFDELSPVLGAQLRALRGGVKRTSRTTKSSLPTEAKKKPSPRKRRP